MTKRYKAAIRTKVKAGVMVKRAMERLTARQAASAQAERIVQ